MNCFYKIYLGSDYYCNYFSLLKTTGWLQVKGRISHIDIVMTHSPHGGDFTWCSYLAGLNKGLTSTAFLSRLSDWVNTCHQNRGHTVSHWVTAESCIFKLYECWSEMTQLNDAHPHLYPCGNCSRKLYGSLTHLKMCWQLVQMVPSLTIP